MKLNKYQLYYALFDLSYSSRSIFIVSYNYFIATQIYQESLRALFKKSYDMTVNCAPMRISFDNDPTLKVKSLDQPAQKYVGICHGPREEHRRQSRRSSLRGTMRYGVDRTARSTPAPIPSPPRREQSGWQ